MADYLFEDSFTPSEDTTEQQEEAFPRLMCNDIPPHPPACLQSCIPNSLIRRGLLNRLLDGDDPLPGSFPSVLMQLCGHMFVTCTVFSDNVHVPFLLFQQLLGGLMNGAEDGTSWDELQPIFNQCLEFLHFLPCYVHRYLVLADHKDSLQPLVEKVAMEIITRLPHMCSQLDPLEELLSTLSLDGRGHLAVTNHVAHLGLHIHWTVLSILYKLVPLLSTSHFLRQAFSALRGLLSHAALVYKLAVSQKELVSSLLFACPCVCEIWLLLLYTLDAMATTTNSTSFWRLVSQILSEEITPSHDLDGSEDYASILPGDAVGFSWWALAQLAPLYCYSKEGTYNRATKGGCPSNWVFVQELLPLTFKPGVSEPELRQCLHSLLQVTQVWAPPAIDPLSKIWDYFHKHMNESFQLPTRGMRSWVTNEGSPPRQWLQYVQSLCSENDPTSEDRSSFELFLRLLAGVLGREEGAWKQLKGRFYSKIHKRWIQDLNGTGLRHFISLFLILSNAVDITEVGAKMVSHLGVVGLGSLRENTTSVLWKGVFALLLLFEERNRDMTPLVEKLVVHMAAVCTKPSISGSCDQRLLWETVGVVLDSLQEVLDTPEGIFLGAAGMIGSHLADLAASQQGPQLSRLLQFSDSVASVLISHYQTLTKEGGMDVGDHTDRMAALRSGCCVYWQYCGLPLLPRARDPLPPPHTATTAATLTVFACECGPLLGQSGSANQFFDSFGVSDSTSPGVASVYLCHVIPNDIIRHCLLSTEHAQLAAVHTWFRSLVLMHNPPACTNDVKELTRVILQLQFIKSLLETQEVSSSEPLAVLQSLLKSINSNHTTAATMQVSMQWRERLAGLLGDLIKYMEPSLSGNVGGEGLKMSYKVTAAIVRTCPRLIYSKTDSRCLFPRLVDRLILPLTTAKKPPVQGVTVCIRAHLHHFLYGLLQLEPQRDDFIKRKIKQIFSKYFYSYSQARHPLIQSVPNPFLLLLQPCVVSGQVSPQVREQLLFIMEVITTQFLVLPQQPASLLPTLQFLRGAVEKIQRCDLLVSLAPTLLGNMLSCLLACDVCTRQAEPQGIRKQVMDTLKPLLRSCQSSRETSSLLPVVRDFIISNFKQCQSVVFQPLLAIAALHPHLIQAVLPAAQRAVEGSETSRGVGNDAELRSALSKLEQRVQELTH